MENTPSAPVTVALITDSNFVMQTVVAVRSLLDSAAPDTRYDVRVITADCTPEAERQLTAVPEITVVRASLDDYRDIRQLAHIPIACLLKFDLCELLPDCDRVLYIDGDVLVREDLSALFHTPLEGHPIGAVPQTVLTGSDDPKFSAGILLFDAARMRNSHMREKLIETRRSLGDRRSMDQQSFNLLLENDYLRFPLRYNYSPIQVSDAVRSWGLPALNRRHGSDYSSEAAAAADAAIIHFATGQKPWAYRNIPFSAEWLACYNRTAYAGTPLQLRRYSVWESRLFGLKSAGKEHGVKGVFRFLWQAVQKKVFHKKITNDWG